MPGVLKAAFVVSFVVVIVLHIHTLLRKRVDNRTKVEESIKSLLPWLFIAFFILHPFKDNRDKVQEVQDKLVQGISQKSVDILDKVCAKGISQRILDEIYKKNGGDSLNIVVEKNYGYNGTKEGQVGEYEIYVFLHKKAEDKKDMFSAYGITLYLKKESRKLKVEDFK